MVDSPAWHLVKALDTLVSADGNTITIENYPTPRPMNAAETAMIAEASKRRSEARSKKQLGVQHWIDDLPWEQANERLESQPTVNIEGLVGGYTGPGGKTILPHKAVAKLDLRLVPDMKATEALANSDLDSDTAVAGKAPRKTLGQAALQIVVADVSMSLDNVLAVAGAARDHFWVLVIGLVLSIGLMGLAASFIARLLHRYRWIAYVGLLIILYVALDMVYRGAMEVWPHVNSAVS